MTTEKPSRRRRHDYGPEIADLICERLMDGESLRQICQDRRMPARSTIFIWLQEHEEFAKYYGFAKRVQIEELLDEMSEIVHDRSNNWIIREGPDGKKFRMFDHENFRSRKRQIGGIQWRVSKLKPKRYHW